MEKRLKPISGTKRITVCGGGNGAHALLALLTKSCNTPLMMYLPLENEFQRFRKAKEHRIPLKLTFKGEESIVPMEELSITQNPEEAASGDLIILVLPAFAHKELLDALVPHLQPDTLLAVLPARGGFEFQASKTLHRNNRKDIIIAGFQTLPWACRIKEYAKSVEVYGQKRRVGFATIPSSPTLKCGANVGDVAQTFNELFFIEFIPYDNMLELTLSNQGQIIHPGIMYGAFADRLDELYCEDEIPLFYQSVDEKTVSLLEAMSQEIMEIKEIVQSKFNIELKGISSTSQWLLESYNEDIDDKSSLAKMFQTNRSYQGLKVPVKAVDGGLYRIDVKSRYLTEDIPYGLLVSKAVAELADVDTPKIDEVIEETSKWINVQYLINGKLEGEDLPKTRIPQNFGLRSIEEIIEMVTLTLVN